MTDGLTPPPPEPPEPPELPPAEPEPAALSRQIALGAIVFVATLAVLFGLTRVLDRGADEPSGAASSPTASQSSSPSASTGASAAASPSVGASATAVPTATGSPGSSADPSAPPTPTPTPSTAIVDPVLVGAGDIADCTTGDDEATAALLDGIDGTVFTAGDNTYPSGTAESFRDCYDPSWGRHLARTRPAPGNHDWDIAGLAGYLDYFGTAATTDGDSWYSYDLGTWHVIVLDSDCAKVGGCDASSDQGQWLAADLAANDEAFCTMAIWHHPRWSSGLHGNDASVAPFWHVLYDADVDVVVNGHDHDYERFAPQDPAGREDRERGIREFVVGTGGVALRDFAQIAVNSELRASLTHGVIRFTLRVGAYDWAFVPTTTDFEDRGTANCH